MSSNFIESRGNRTKFNWCRYSFLYDLWWNPAVEEQAAGRAHRMGQKKVVEVWRMIAEGTVEEKMNSLQQEKRELFQKVIQGNEEQLAKMTEEDIRTILSIGE